MRRREFITLVGGAVAVWPLAARAQQASKRKVGFLGANTPATAGHLAEAFVARLRQLGWIEGKNLAIEYRWAAGQTAKFRELADELIASGVEVIVTSGNAPALAAAQATKSIPIVLASSADIVSAGLVKSLAHPGGNVTGLTFVPEDTVGKRLELLREAVSGVSRIGVLYNPDANPEQVAALREVAPKQSTALSIIEFRSIVELDRINELPERPDIKALFVVSDPLVFVNRVAINQFALRERLPTVHMLREYVVDGGLLSYGPLFPDFFSRAGDFVDKILQGTKVEELPVERAAIFRLTINLRTAKALGLIIPEAFLLRADEVIE
jgi:putative ABC transport system substrate-binding protein